MRCCRARRRRRAAVGQPVLPSRVWPGRCMVMLMYGWAAPMAGPLSCRRPSQVPESASKIERPAPKSRKSSGQPQKEPARDRMLEKSRAYRLCLGNLVRPFCLFLVPSQTVSGRFAFSFALEIVSDRVVILLSKFLRVRSPGPCKSQRQHKWIATH
jgi:hypothetical protein